MAKDQPIVDGPKRFNVESVDIVSLQADVRVETHDKPDVEVTVTGLPEQVKSIYTSIYYGESLVIQDKGLHKPSSETPVTVLVKIPAGMPVTVTAGNNDITIGDTYGPVTINSAHSGNASVGAVTDVNLNLQGSGSVLIAKANGDVTLKVAGSGGVHVADGSIHRLTIDSDGSGLVVVGGTAEYAKIRLLGEGDIRIAHVTYLLTGTDTGSGHLRINESE